MVIFKSEMTCGTLHLSVCAVRFWINSMLLCFRRMLAEIFFILGETWFIHSFVLKKEKTPLLCFSSDAGGCRPQIAKARFSSLQLVWDGRMILGSFWFYSCQVWTIHICGKCGFFMFFSLVSCSFEGAEICGFSWVGQGRGKFCNSGDHRPRSGLQ